MDRIGNNRNGLANGSAGDDWIVRDDLSPAMPVSDEELAVVEAWLGAMIAEIMQTDKVAATARIQTPRSTVFPLRSQAKRLG